LGTTGPGPARTLAALMLNCADNIIPFMTALAV